MNRRLTLHDAELPLGVVHAPLVDVDGAVRRRAQAGASGTIERGTNPSHS